MSEYVSEPLYACTLCDEKVHKSGRGGHLKFTGGGGHGDRGDMPEKWDENTEEFFAETGESEGNGEETSTTTGQDDGSTEESEPAGNKPPSGGGTDTSGSTTNGSIFARARVWLTTPIKDL